MLADLTVKEFLSKTASNDPVPGGGSIAALSAGVAAALSEMVANLTIGKKGYEDKAEQMKDLAKKAAECRVKFISDIDKDSDAFNKVMDAFSMPKTNDEEIAKRKQVIQEATKNATIVPLEVAQDAFDIMGLCEQVVVNGNKNAVTDGAVAAMMARTAVLSALYNVKINLGSIKDTDFVTDISKKVIELETKVSQVESDILSKVKL